jgi:hypothetical protein
MRHLIARTARKAGKENETQKHQQVNFILFCRNLARLRACRKKKERNSLGYIILTAPSPIPTVKSISNFISLHPWQNRATDPGHPRNQNTSPFFQFSKNKTSLLTAPPVQQDPLPFRRNFRYHIARELIILSRGGKRGL